MRMLEISPLGPARDVALLVVRAAVVGPVAGQGQVAAQQPELRHRDQTWPWLDILTRNNSI